MKHVNLRLPDETHAVLVTMAEAERRSLNSMMVILIEAERGRREGSSVKPPPAQP